MELDSSQEVAYGPITKSFFVTAPAGHGKTFVMIERIKFLISSGTLKPPQKILAITFSNSAANEMRARIQKNIPKSDQYVDIMNFHRFSYKLLRLYGNLVGINRNFTIIDEDKEKKFKLNYFENLGFRDHYEKEKEFNKWFYSLKFLKKGSNNYFDELKLDIENNLINKNEITFDYLLFYSLLLFQDFKYIKSAIFNKYLFVLADEFQDTNYMQYLLFKEIATDINGDKRNIFVVGDKKQSIMKFQGATPDNLDELINDFDCIEKKLEENHRAKPKIINITNQLRGLKSSNDFEFKMYLSERCKDENSNIIKVITSLVSKGTKLHEIGILFPLNDTPNKLKKELKGKFSYISLNDFKYSKIKDKYPKIFEQIEKDIKNKVLEGSVKGIIKKSIYSNYIIEFKREDLILTLIYNFSKAFDKGDYKPLLVWQRLQEFYNYLKIEIDWPKLVKSKTKDKLFLSTIHSAKSSEFKFVLLFGIVNYRLPHFTTCYDDCHHGTNFGDFQLDEEKDVFYVGVSRSMEDVYFFFSKKDEINNNGGRKISCVFNEIKDMLVFIDDNGTKFKCEDDEVKNLFCSY